MPFLILIIWTIVATIIIPQVSFSEEKLKIIQSTGRAAIQTDILKEEAKNLALEDALYYAALKGGAKIDGFSHVNSQTTLEDEFLVRPVSKILDYRVIDEVIDDTHYQITIEAIIGENNKNIGCQNRPISQLTLFRPNLKLSNNVPGWMSQLPLRMSQLIAINLSEKPKLRLRDARHTPLELNNIKLASNRLDYKSLTTGRIQMRNGDFAITTEINFEGESEARLLSKKEFLIVKLKSHFFYSNKNFTPEIIVDEFKLRLGSRFPIRSLSVLSKEQRETLIKLLDNAAILHAKKITEKLVCYPMSSVIFQKEGKLYINIGKRQGLEKNHLAFAEGKNTPWTMIKVQDVLENLSIVEPLDKNKNLDDLNGMNITFLEF